MVHQAHRFLTSDLGQINDLQAWFSHLVDRHTQNVAKLESKLSRLNLALVEGFSNAVRHAHAGLPQETTIKVEVDVEADSVIVRIWDTGKPFNPDTLIEPLPGTLRKGGYGWFLLRRLVDRVSYDRLGDRNCLRLELSI